MVMVNEKDLREEINQVSSLGQLVEVYGEIASFRMKKIRDFVLKNRDFLDSINDIFRDALNSYSRKLANLVAKGKLKKGGRVTFLAHNPIFPPRRRGANISNTFTPVSRSSCLVTISET